MIGAVAGAAGAGIYIAVSRALPPSLAALACVLFWAAVSRPVKEKRAGAFHWIALAISVAARWLALDHFAGPSLLATCIAAQAVPRAAMLGLAWTSRPAGDGSGYALASTLGTPAALLALAQGAVAAFFCGARAGVVILLGSFLIARLLRSYFYRRSGGVNGDCLGAAEQTLEIFILALFACQACSW